MATHDTSEKTETNNQFGIFRRASQTRTDDLSTHVFGLLASEGWGQATGDDVHENWLGCKRGDGRLQELFSLDTLDEAHVGTSIRCELETRDSLVHAEHLR